MGRIPLRSTTDYLPAPIEAGVFNRRSGLFSCYQSREDCPGRARSLSLGVRYPTGQGDGQGVDEVSRRVSVREAARLLDVSESAVHKRVQRGTLKHDKDPDGRVFIYLDDVTDTVSDTVQHPSTDPLISEMHSRIDSLERQLEHERAANRENRRLLAAALERIPAIEPPETPGEPQAASEESERVDAQDRGEEAQEGAERRSWWRRFFGE